MFDGIMEPASRVFKEFDWGTIEEPGPRRAWDVSSFKIVLVFLCDHEFNVMN